MALIGTSPALYDCRPSMGCRGNRTVKLVFISSMRAFFYFITSIL